MERRPKKKEEKKLATTFYSKQKILCPICKKDFEKEELMSGGGRLIAGALTDELRRTYEPSARYGTIYPLTYTMGACPVCHAAFFWNDFDEKFEEDEIGVILDNEETRKKSVEALFPHYDFKRNRTLLDGAAAYYLALLCYEKMSKNWSPTIKKAQISLRLAWMCSDLDIECPDRNYDFASKVFYRKALFFYQESLVMEMGHQEDIAGIGNFGPDIDKNYGYDGVIYLCGLLEYKYGQQEDISLRLKKLDEFKRAIARVFGLGKSSKNKPGPLLEHSRNLYDTITAVLKEANIIDLDDDEDNEQEEKVEE